MLPLRAVFNPPLELAMLEIARTGSFKDVPPKEAVHWDQYYAERWQRFGCYKPTTGSTPSANYTIDSIQSMIVCVLYLDRKGGNPLFREFKTNPLLKAATQNWMQGKPGRLTGEFEQIQKYIDDLIGYGLIAQSSDDWDSIMSSWTQTCCVGIYQNRYEVPKNLAPLLNYLEFEKAFNGAPHLNRQQLERYVGQL